MEDEKVNTSHQQTETEGGCPTCLLPQSSPTTGPATAPGPMLGSDGGCPSQRPQQQQRAGGGMYPSHRITLTISPTTGGHFELQVNHLDSIAHLKKMISKKLKVAKERICLLYKDRDLKDGSLKENNIRDGSNITLLPTVETGLLTQRPEQSVLQALESLTDSQVNDFLSGKSPLNLTMRLGDHMMFIQLQLSTVGTSNQTTHRNSKTPGSSAPCPSVRPHSPLLTDVTDVPALASTVPPFTLPPSHSVGDHRMPSYSPHSPSSPPPFVPPPPLPGDSPVATLGQHPASCGRTSPPSHRATDSSTVSHEESCKCHLTDVTHLLDTRTLAEASRNLSQTLRHLSTQALSDNKNETECSDHCPSRRPGAIIESMHHHGRGVYSGTFSGTLNPALQDRHGLPKRDISTIVHILNDLLGATPQYRHQGGRSLLAGSSSSLSFRAPTRQHFTSGILDASALPATATKDFSRLSQENRATRGKMEQLQLMLEERRARRRARREARGPYIPISSAATASPWSMGMPGIPNPTLRQSGNSDASPMRLEDTNTNNPHPQLAPGTPNATTSPTSMDVDQEGTDAAAATPSTEYIKVNPEPVVV